MPPDTLGFHETPSDLCGCGTLLNSPDSTGRGWTAMDMAGTKNPVSTGFSALLWIRLDPDLVEAAGVEPASASTLPLALHA